MTDFAYSPMFPQAADDTAYELVSTEHVEMVELGGEEFLKRCAFSHSVLSPIFRIYFAAATWPSYAPFLSLIHI